MYHICKNIPWGEYTEEEMQMDDAVIEKISGDFMSKTSLRKILCRKNIIWLR